VALDLPLLHPALAPRVVRVAGWTVASRAGVPGGVRLLRHRGDLRLEVGDGVTPGARTCIDLRADGTIRVHASTTPPALLVASDGARPVPTLSGAAEEARLDSGQRLLVLSSDALDALPVSLAAVLQSLPARLTQAEPDEVLRELSADLDGGSAAIVLRDAAPRPARPR
jgi:hypothetical protein